MEGELRLRPVHVVPNGPRSKYGMIVTNTGATVAEMVPLYAASGVAKVMNTHDSMLYALTVAKSALEHDAPASCWATGPNTGDIVEDLVVCPGCRALSIIDKVISMAKGDNA